MAIHSTQIWSMLVLLVLGSNLGLGHEGHHSGSCASAVHEAPVHHHCDHGHDHHHRQEKIADLKKLPEELAEEEDLILYRFGSHHGHDHDHDQHGASELSGAGLWIHAMWCSLLVSMASLICLIILPVIFIQGKPSKVVVDSLAAFGAGAMLGDAFLHQLPHAFGGKHSNSHNHVVDNAHSRVHFGYEHSQFHSHSLQDLSVGLSVLAGIILFLLVEKTVRYIEDNSGGANEWSHSHHHHHHKNSKNLKHSDDNDKIEQQSDNEKSGSISKMSSEEKVLNPSDDCLIGEKQTQSESLLRKRKTGSAVREDKPISESPNGSTDSHKPVNREEPSHSPSSPVFGYLNLFSDGVHNFTDGMALGSAFLLYGSVGGWSRTLFLLAHELPQEIGDFGILVRSGFSVSKALFFNFLSALVALAGTALALMLGQDPGQSSLIEGFTAGGFVYIAVAGVLAEMNNGSSSIKSTAIQLTSLILGMSVALCISLVE
ncbi:IAA-alanine resistance protein 1-like isoform X1 [Actinidia eriantha]|uniref:IAA-alanine resistance protein 1-like isoform X1 n=1 Tax=Actinidia eriantha TaxID=165200 RepID=UPI00258A00AB|nr:IAA-alanine resistance protein 1-like isoform X1 [Actinidia eriantha]